MNTPGYNDPDFDQVITGGYTDPHPYGTPTPAVKTGLTPRGKAALGVGTAVIACGTLFGWQQYTAQQANADVKAQEIALKQQQIELEKLKEINKANAAQQEKQESENSGQQKHVEACVEANGKLVGKLMGVTYQSVRDECQAKYPTTSAAGMQAAANTTSTDAASDGDGSNVGLLLGIGALVLLGGGTAKKFTKSSQA
jgi:hypothetical protein